MWIGNLFPVILNLPMIGLWVRIIMVPYQFLYPAILSFCAIGVFSALVIQISHNEQSEN